MSAVDLHSHKLREFGSEDAARSFAFANHIETAFPHRRDAGPIWAGSTWVLVFWNSALGCMCGIISAETCCTLPGW